MKIFLDTAPIIYLIDADERYVEKIKNFLQNTFDRGDSIVTSVITAEEYLVHPYKTKNSEKISDFYSFISECKVEVVDINLEISDKAALIRAEYPFFKSMDALQLSSAVKSGCSVFYTNDKQLKRFRELEISIVDE